MHLNLLLEFSKVFDEPKKDISCYLLGIKQSNIINITNLFLRFTNRESQYSCYDDLLKMFFQVRNFGFYEYLISKIKYIETQQKNAGFNYEIVILTNQTALNLFEFALIHLNDKQLQTDQEAEINLFKAILLLNEEISQKQELAEETTQGLPTEIKPAGFYIASNFAFNDYTNYDKYEIFVTQTVKSLMYFNFVENNQETRNLLRIFLEENQVENWKDYLNSILSFVISIFQAPADKYIDVKINDDNYKEKSIAVLDRFNIQNIEDIVDYDFVKLRSNPLLKINEITYRIIFELFAIELIHKGLFFKFWEISKKSKLIDNFKSYYCLNFSEKYLLYKTLKDIYKNKYKQFSGEELASQGIDGAPDYYIRNGNNVFIFESKDILIEKSIKQSYNYISIEIELKKKLYFEERENGRLKNQAIKQLIENIKGILLKKNDYDQEYKSDNLNIYPILVLFDNQLNISGLNVLLSSWFNNELAVLRENGINISRVKPLIIISIDTLIFHQERFSCKEFSLKNCIENYIRWTTFNPKKVYKNKEEVQEHRLRALKPFSIYISNYFKDIGICKTPMIFIDLSKQLFENQTKNDYSGAK